MRSDVDTIKERLDIAEIVSQYIKLTPAGKSLKACCPFHNEKTPSFFVSPERQSYYCFGCGAKGDIFTFVESMEGVGFNEALKNLAEKAGVELSARGSSEKRDKTPLFEVMEEATKFFEGNLAENKSAKDYLASRGLLNETIKDWRLGYVKNEWQSLYSHLLERGYSERLMFSAGLVKKKDESSEREPYDVFRGRLMFPLFDSNGKVIAFSGRIFSSESESEAMAGSPKYINSPDTILFTKSEVLYGLDKAKEHIRRKDYAVLVEGQIDLILSHQAGVKNTVASSGTAFGRTHLERLKKLSRRIILAFDGDEAGEKAARRSIELGIALGLEVKTASLPKGEDPASLIKTDPDKWRALLRQSVHAIEYLLAKIEEKEKDQRKIGQAVERIILPLVKLLSSAIERSHFLSVIAKRTGIKEDVLAEALKQAEAIKVEDYLPREKTASPFQSEAVSKNKAIKKTMRELIEERLAEVKALLKEIGDNAPEISLLIREEEELLENLDREIFKDNLAELRLNLAKAEAKKDDKLSKKISSEIQKVIERISRLEERGKKL